MSSLEDYVIAWLDTVPRSNATAKSIPAANTTTKKRKAYDLLSPPQSTDENTAPNMATETPRSKRARADDENVGEVTPRPGAPLSISGRGAAVPSLSSSRTESYHSGRSSPSKELSKLELESDGIETRVLDTDIDNIPEALRKLTEDMKAIRVGWGVIPSSLKDKIRESRAVTGPSLRIVFDEEAGCSDNADTSESSDRLYEAVCDVVSESRDCLEQQQVEMGWNNLVHTPLLKAALSGRDSFSALRVTPCMTAKIIREYLPVYRPGKMVDYTISIKPGDGNAKHPDYIAIDELRKDLPLGTVNHTDFDALRRRPVAISIETKRHGEQESRAQTQISVWHAAQWKFLANLVGDRITTLDYIPGFIVIGHEWKFIASTYEDGKTTMWVDSSIGSTTSVAGTFQVIAGIRRLAQWAIETYWPWYRKELLKLP